MKRSNTDLTHYISNNFDNFQLLNLTYLQGQSNKGPRSNTDVIHFILNNFNNFQFMSLIKVQGNQIRGPATIISLLYTVFLQISQKSEKFQ